MPKDPVLPLYYNDIDRTTKDWTDEEFGAYMRLLIHQWDKQSLPNDMTRLQRIAFTVKKHWKLLQSKFPKSEDGLLRNPRMEEIRDARERFKERQKERVLKRYQKATKDPTVKPTGIDTVEATFLETEIEKEKKGGAGGKEIGSDAAKQFAREAWADVGWRESLCMGLSMNVNDLKKWMAQFNASISCDSIPDFSLRSYKKMLRGWISKQQQNGNSIQNSSQIPTGSAPIKQPENVH